MSSYKGLMAFLEVKDKPGTQPPDIDYKLLVKHTQLAGESNGLFARMGKQERRWPNCGFPRIPADCNPKSMTEFGWWEKDLDTHGWSGGESVDKLGSKGMKRQRGESIAAGDAAGPSAEAPSKPAEEPAERGHGALEQHRSSATPGTNSGLNKEPASEIGSKESGRQQEEAAAVGDNAELGAEAPSRPAAKLAEMEQGTLEQHDRSLAAPAVDDKIDREPANKPGSEGLERQQEEAVVAGNNAGLSTEVPIRPTEEPAAKDDNDSIKSVRELEQALEAPLDAEVAEIAKLSAMTENDEDDMTGEDADLREGKEIPSNPRAATRPESRVSCDQEGKSDEEKCSKMEEKEQGKWGGKDNRDGAHSRGERLERHKGQDGSNARSQLNAKGTNETSEEHEMRHQGKGGGERPPRENPGLEDAVEAKDGKMTAELDRRATKAGSAPKLRGGEATDERREGEGGSQEDRKPNEGAEATKAKDEEQTGGTGSWQENTGTKDREKAKMTSPARGEEKHEVDQGGELQNDHRPEHPLKEGGDEEAHDTAAQATAKGSEGMEGEERGKGRENEDPGKGRAKLKIRAPGAWPKVRPVRRLPTRKLREDQRATVKELRGSESSKAAEQTAGPKKGGKRGTAGDTTGSQKSNQLRWPDSESSDSTSSDSKRSESSDSSNSSELSGATTRRRRRAAQEGQSRGESDGNEQNASTASTTQHQRQRRGRLRTTKVVN